MQQHKWETQIVAIIQYNTIERSNETSLHLLRSMKILINIGHANKSFIFSFFLIKVSASTIIKVSCNLKAQAHGCQNPDEIINYIV